MNFEGQSTYQDQPSKKWGFLLEPTSTKSNLKKIIAANINIYLTA